MISSGGLSPISAAIDADGRFLISYSPMNFDQFEAKLDQMEEGIRAEQEKSFGKEYLEMISTSPHGSSFELSFTQFVGDPYLD